MTRTGGAITEEQQTEMIKQVSRGDPPRPTFLRGEDKKGMKGETGRKVKHRNDWGNRLSSVAELLPRVYFTVTPLFISPEYVDDGSILHAF